MKLACCAEAIFASFSFTLNLFPALHCDLHTRFTSLSVSISALKVCHQFLFHLSVMHLLHLKFNYEIRNYALSPQAPFLLTNKPHVQCISSTVSVKTATVPWPTDNFPFLKRFIQWKFSRSHKGENFAVMVRTTKEWLATKKQARTPLKVFNTVSYGYPCTVVT